MTGLVAATMLLAMTNLSANFSGTKSSHQFQQASLRDSVNALIEQDQRSAARWPNGTPIKTQAAGRSSTPRQKRHWPQLLPLPC